MSTDAGSAAAPEDAAARSTAGDRPGLGSADPESADSQTSNTETADRGTGGSAPSEAGRAGGDDAEAGDTAGVGSAERGPSDGGDEGFVAGMLRDATITGLPGETGAPPVEPHAPQAQQEGDEPVGSEPPVGDNPRGVD
jgi:hypothetical protein